MERAATDPAAALYRGSSGQDYHEQRADGRSARSQAVRRRYFDGIGDASLTLLDFGCATGAMTALLPARTRVGVEVNERAAAEARGRLDRVVDDIKAVADGSVDRIVSFHAIEHVRDPLALFGEFRRVLSPTGSGRLIVPYESIFLNPEQRRWTPGNSDMHLFAWTPLTFGNALSVAGLAVRSVRVTHWAGEGRIGRVLAPVGLAPAMRWVRSLRERRLQIVADFDR